MISIVNLFKILSIKKAHGRNKPRALKKRAFFHFGNPAIPEGPVAFRPTIARGLALSV